MRILIIGGSGTLGKTLVSYFSQDCDVITAGRNSGDFQVDIAQGKSIEAMLKKTGQLNAIICVAGEAKWADFDELSEEDYYLGIRSKLMGQVNLVRLGQKYISPGGSVTLTSGILADDPVAMTSSAAMVNGALHSFVKAVSLDLRQDIRVNVVAPGLVELAVEKYQKYFPGHHPVSMEKMLRGYIRSVEGKGNGEVIRIYE